MPACLAGDVGSIPSCGAIHSTCLRIVRLRVIDASTRTVQTFAGLFDSARHILPVRIVRAPLLQFLRHFPHVDIYVLAGLGRISQ